MLFLVRRRSNNPQMALTSTAGSRDPQGLSTRLFLLGPNDSPPPSAEVRVEFGAESRARAPGAANTDHYMVVRLGRNQETLLTSLPREDTPQRFDEFAHGLLVADGLGATGEEASRLAITTLTHMALHFGRWNVRINPTIAEEVMERGKRFYRGVDSVLLEAGKGRAGLQSTLTAVYSAGNEMFVVHVGHSRAYLFRDGQLLPLTHDDTVSSTRPAWARTIDPADSARDLHHILTDVLGQGEATGPTIDIERCGILDGDVVLLCTNGLTDVVDDARIADTLQRNKKPADQCRALVALAVQSGSNDDVTAITGRYQIVQRSPD